MNKKIEYKETKFNNWYIQKLDDKFQSESLEYIFNHMMNKYISIFGETLMLNEKCIIYLDTYADCPMLVLNQEVLKIRLSISSPTHWCQVIYQLSHELCHYALRQSNVTIPCIGWFEETMCESISLYMLDYFYNTWGECELSKYNPEYSKSIKQYLSEEVSSAQGPSILSKCLNLFSLASIEKTCTINRKGRSTDRNRIYYLFKNNPEKIYMISNYKNYLVNEIGINFESWIKNENNDKFIKSLSYLTPNLKL